MQITKWLPDNLDNMCFCGQVINDIWRDKQRDPVIRQKCNKRGEPVLCVIDDSICTKHQQLIYKATGEPLLPQYEVKDV